MDCKEYRDATEKFEDPNEGRFPFNDPIFEQVKEHYQECEFCQHWSGQRYLKPGN